MSMTWHYGLTERYMKRKMNYLRLLCGVACVCVWTYWTFHSLSFHTHSTPSRPAISLHLIHIYTHLLYKLYCTVYTEHLVHRSAAAAYTQQHCVEHEIYKMRTKTMKMPHRLAIGCRSRKKRIRKNTIPKSVYINFYPLLLYKIRCDLQQSVENGNGK